MKTLLRYLGMVAAVGGVVFVAGCATADSPRSVTRAAPTRQIGPTSEFKVVDSSFGREPTAQEMSQLRDGVARLLESQGVAQSGEYYVRVNFAAAAPDAAGDWVVVKVTNLPASTYTLIASYPAIGPDDYYPYSSGYSQDYGYGGSAYSYNVPPAYYPANYHPRPWPGTPRHRDDDDKPDDHQKWNKDGHPPGGGTPTGYDGPRDRTDRKPRGDYHPDAPRTGPRSDYGGGSSGGRRDSAPGPNNGSGARTYSPPAPVQRSGGSNYSAPPAPAPVSAPVSPPAPAVSARPNDRQQQN